MENATAGASENPQAGDNGRALLQNFCENGFEGDVSRTALVLGRRTDEIEEMLSGGADFIDEDLILKIRGIADERGISIEPQ
jgi:hypothetical protein